MRRTLTAVVSVLVLSWQTGAQAAVLTFDYTAIGTQGGTLVGQFSYDTTRPDLEPLANFGTYDSARLRGVISGGPQSGQSFNTLAFADTANKAPGLGTDALRVGDNVVAIVLSDPTGVALSSEALPTGLGAWDLSQSIVSVEYRNTAGSLTAGIFRLSSLSLVAVPEPMTLGLFGLGAAGLALLGRRAARPHA